MLCQKCQKEIERVEFTLEYKIHKCDCGNRIITKYDNKEISAEERLEIEDLYNEGD